MATVHYLDLPQEFARMDLPKEYAKVFGNKKLTRVLTFVEHFQVTNEDYDNLMAIRPERQNGETVEQHRTRKELRDQLSQYKSHFYDYSVYSKKSAEIIPQTVKA